MPIRQNRLRGRYCRSDEKWQPPGLTQSEPNWKGIGPLPRGKVSKAFRSVELNWLSEIAKGLFGVVVIRAAAIAFVVSAGSKGSQGSKDRT